MNEQNEQNEQQRQETETEGGGQGAGAPGFFQVMKSVIASGLGVQSRENMERDMRSRSPLPYIAVGLLGTLLFIAVVITVVRLVLKAAGA